MLDPADVIAIHELLARYGHVIDERQWSRLGEIFTDDVSYQADDFAMPRLSGLAALTDLWSAPATRHPLAHHATNIVVTEDADGTVRVLSKGIGVGYGGRIGSVVYRDVVRRTEDGWRLAARTVTLRTPGRSPNRPDPVRVRMVGDAASGSGVPESQAHARSDPRPDRIHARSGHDS